MRSTPKADKSGNFHGGVAERNSAVRVQARNSADRGQPRNSADGGQPRNSADGGQVKNFADRGERWCVVISKPAAEEVAERSIREAGYRVYLPRYRKVLHGIRLDDRGRRIRTRGPGAVVMRPLINGYLFAELHPSHDGILTAMRPVHETVVPNSDGSLALCRQSGPPLAGVDRLLRYRASDGCRGLPKLVHPEIIEMIREIERSGEFDERRLTGKRADIKAGDQVRINRGAFAGFMAELVDLDQDGTAHWETELFGRMTRGSGPADDLSLVSA